MTDMRIGIFQLLPRGTAASDREVIEQALWEVDFAEAHGFDSIWIAEHHFSGFGLVGAPSVWAATIAQRTKRIRIAYGVAVLPLHQPLRLAEEIAWLDHLSEGRLMVGVGPGFDAGEFAGFDVPLGERHERLGRGFDVMRRALTDGTVRPHPYTQPHPPFFLAASSDESMQTAIANGIPMLLGFSSLAERLDRYRALRAAAGVGGDVIEREIGAMYVLRRVGDDAPRELAELRDLGVRNVIAWIHTDETPHAQVRRLMERIAEEVLPAVTPRVGETSRYRERTLPVPPPRSRERGSRTPPPALPD